jgi:cytochrome oxidase Cu insertion factor (SCO1/SenC/PrrC family)
MAPAQDSKMKQNDARFFAPADMRAMSPRWLRAALSCVLLSLPLLVGYVADARATDNPLLDRLPQRWLDDQGRDTRLSDFRDRRVFFAMAYATCRRVCPMTMARLQQLQREVDASGDSAEFVIVGYDPTADDPQTWRQYRRSRGLLRDNWHFLTGTVTSTAQFASQLGLPFWKYDRHVMHDSRIVVVDAHGELTVDQEVRSGEN